MVLMVSRGQALLITRVGDKESERVDGGGGGRLAMHTPRALLNPKSQLTIRHNYPFPPRVLMKKANCTESALSRS